MIGRLYNLGLVALVGGFCIAAGQASAETKLNFSNFVPSNHFLSKEAILPWIEQVSEVTNGEVRIEIAPKVVGSTAGQYDVLVDGLADLTLFVPGYTPGRFELAGLGELPSLTENAEIACVAFQRLYDTYLAETGLFSDVHVLAAFTANPHALFTRDTLVDSSDDLKGLKIRIPGPANVPVMEGLGAVPVQKPVTELYEMMSSGVLDGTVSGPDQALAYKLHEIAGHLTIVPGGLSNSVMVIAMSKDAWNRLDPAQQKAITEISGEPLARSLGATFRPRTEEAIAKMREGGTVTIADAALVADISKNAAPLEAELLDAARKAGIADPVAMMAWYRGQISALSK